MKVYCVMECYLGDYEYRDLHAIFSSKEKAEEKVKELTEESFDNSRLYYEIEIWNVK